MPRGGGAVPVTKPPSVARDPYRSSKWDALTEGRDFRPSDVPALTLLVQWYQVVDQCVEDLTLPDGGIQVAYSNKLDDIRALPQIATMKQASAEIRQLNKQLGIDDGRDSGAMEGDDGEDDVLKLVIGRGPAARRTG